MLQLITVINMNMGRVRMKFIKFFRFYDENGEVVGEIKKDEDDVLNILFYVHCCQLDILEPTDDDILMFEMIGFKVDCYISFKIIHRNIIEAMGGCLYTNITKAKVSHNSHVNAAFVDIKLGPASTIPGVSIMNKNRIMRF